MKYFAMCSEHRSGRHKIFIRIFLDNLDLKKNTPSYVEESEINYTTSHSITLAPSKLVKYRAKTLIPEIQKILNSPCIKYVLTQRRKHRFIGSIYYKWR